MTKTYFIGKGQGTSMQPVINAEDKLFVEKVKLKDIKIGDIVVFYNTKILVGHRVIKIQGRKIITKGDNVPYLDKPIDGNIILGKIITIDGKYGSINLKSFLAKITAYYFLFFSLATYYIPLWLRSNLPRFFRGRKILVKLLALNSFSNIKPDKMVDLSKYNNK